MKFLNIFNKKNKEPEKAAQDDIPVIAAVTYSIDNTGEMFIDVNMEDFDDNSIEALAVVLSMVSTIKCQLMTMDMIKHSFAKEGKVQEYLKLVTAVIDNTADLLAETRNENSEEPYIKPSDMM